MDEALIKRVLPHSVEAEQSVIGSMLMDREAIIAASEIITGADFYQHQYGVMFESMVELFNEGKPVDLVTLQNRLREKDVPPEVSSLDFVRDIMTSVPTSVNVKSYATKKEPPKNANGTATPEKIMSKINTAAIPNIIMCVTSL